MKTRRSPTPYPRRNNNPPVVIQTGHHGIQASSDKPRELIDTQKVEEEGLGSGDEDHCGGHVKDEYAFKLDKALWLMMLWNVPVDLVFDAFSSSHNPIWPKYCMTGSSSN